MNIKSIFSALTVALLLTACGGTEMENAEAVGAREDQLAKTDDPVADLEANAVKFDDLLGLAKRSLGTVQSVYNDQQGAVHTLGEVTVLLDDNFILSIQNKIDGDILEQRVNLKNLNSELESFDWIVDNGENPYPGVRVPTLDEKSSVEILEDGSLQGTESYLEIILSERKAVQKCLSGLINAIRAARDEPLEGNR